MDIKLPFSLLNLFPCHSKYTEVHFSGSSKLNSWMEGGSPLPHLHVPPPPPPAVQGERQSAILCFLAIYSYRACKQALLWYPVVRGWGGEKGEVTPPKCPGRACSQALYSGEFCTMQKRQLFAFIPLCGASVFRAVLQACELDAWYPASNTADLICISEGVLQWRTPHKWSTV